MPDINDTSFAFKWLTFSGLKFYRDCRGRDRMVDGLQLPMQPVPIITNVVSSNPAEVKCTRYNIM